MGRKLDCILLVDDDEPTNYLNRMIINEMNCVHHIEVAQTGKQALEFLRDSSGKKKNEDRPYPELVFLDINMPAMDGWEFLEELKQINTRQTVVVMLTTSLNPDDEIKANLNSRIRCFVHKPLNKEIVSDILAKYF